MSHEHIALAVADAETPGRELVPAREVGKGEWQLLRSPLHAMHVASGDVVRVLNSATGEFAVLARGGNVCVQFYLGEDAANDANATASIAEALEQEVHSLGGSVDAHTPGLIAFTVPAAAGFSAIEQLCAAAVQKSPGAQWQYSNVYDPTTGALLRWWE